MTNCMLKSNYDYCSDRRVDIQGNPLGMREIAIQGFALD